MPSNVKVYVVTDAEADATIAREVAREGSDTRRALDGWAMDGGGLGGGVAIVGEPPIRLEDNGDGTGYISAVSSAATITKSADETYITVAMKTGGTA